MSTMSFQVNCNNCGHLMMPFVEACPGDEVLCPKCSSSRKQVIARFEDKIELQEEFDGTASNRQGVTTAERISRTDGNTSSTIAADLAQPAEILSVRQRRVEGFDEEGVFAEALATARNARRGTRYSVKPKPREDSGYADRELVSTVDQPREIEIQMRHFDTEAAASINPRKKSTEPGEFKGKRDVSNLSDGIRKAITAKAKVDTATKAKTILLLLIPSPIGQMARNKLQRLSFDFKGFMEVWVAPFREKAFELFPPRPHRDGCVLPVGEHRAASMGRRPAILVRRH